MGGSKSKGAKPKKVGGDAVQEKVSSSALGPVCVCKEMVLPFLYSSNSTHTRHHYIKISIVRGISANHPCKVPLQTAAQAVFTHVDVGASIGRYECALSVLCSQILNGLNLNPIESSHPCTL